MSRRYVIPGVLKRMVVQPCWPIAVVYHDDGMALVECGRWAREGWVAYTESYPESELPEQMIAEKFGHPVTSVPVSPGVGNG